MNTEFPKKSDIKLTVSLDENQVPAAIDWMADDSGMPGTKPCKAVLLGLWDGDEQTTLRIDLWTKEMSVDEMKRFFYETFMGLADTYERATFEKDVANEIRGFGEHFSKIADVK
jgi:gliding motility-associated protein GldC